MDVIKQFDVDIFGLKEGTHEFEHQITDAFFSAFEDSLIEKGSLTCRIVLDKSDRLISAEIRILGIVELICDRSLEIFDFPLRIDERVIYKYGDETRELDTNVFVITPSTQKLKLTQIIYELISVAIPMKKLHPKFEQDDPDKDEFVYQSSNRDDEVTEMGTLENDIDPRWEALKKLKDNLKK